MTRVWIQTAPVYSLDLNDVGARIPELRAWEVECDVPHELIARYQAVDAEYRNVKAELREIVKREKRA